MRTPAVRFGRSLDDGFSGAAARLRLSAGGHGSRKASQGGRLQGSGPDGRLVRCCGGDLVPDALW